MSGELPDTETGVCYARALPFTEVQYECSYGELGYWGSVRVCEVGLCLHLYPCSYPCLLGGHALYGLYRLSGHGLGFLN